MFYGYVIMMVMCVAFPAILHVGFNLQGKKMKCIFGVNIFSFVSFVVTMLMIMWSGSVLATGEASELAKSDGIGLIAAALSTGLACIGSGVAVAAASSAALGAISEDGTIMGKSMIFVALSEGIALYGLLISFMILGKI